MKTLATPCDPADVHRYVRGVCFKTGPPGPLGLELEWLVAPLDDLAARPSPDLLGSLVAEPGLPGGATLSLEPGGQLELATALAPDLDTCITRIRADLAALRTRLTRHGLTLLDTAIEPLRAPSRILHTPRYDAMAAHFTRAGREHVGSAMMTGTASIQVNLEPGSDPDQRQLRWDLLHALGPTLSAAFANSPVHEGRRTGFASTRQHVWQQIDPAHAHPPLDADAYAAYALDAPVMTDATGRTLRDWASTDRPPTTADVDAHLTRLFPPVRARGWFEVRYLDALPGDWWSVPGAVLSALVDDARAAPAVLEITRAGSGLWCEAARCGLGHPVLARSAHECFALAVTVLRGRGSPLAQDVEAYAERFVRRARTPADDIVDLSGGPRDSPDDRNGRVVLDAHDGHGARVARDVPVTDPARHDKDTLMTSPSQPRSGPVPAAMAKDDIARELERVRRRSLALTREILDDDELLTQHSPLMSPLVWDLAHVGNYEELWLLRAAAGVQPMRPEIDTIYDAFEHPRADRPQLPLLSPAESTGYLEQVRAKVFDGLDAARFDDTSPLLHDGFVYGLVLQHEHQHDETMLATHQLRRGAPVLPADAPDPSSVAGGLPAEVVVPAGPFVMGTSGDPWAYDNERPEHVVDLPAYAIDTVPVTNAAYAAFLADGGYRRRQWWGAQGWRWRSESGRDRPAFWVRDGQGWARRRFGRVEPLPAREPVQHVCFHEAQAYAAWAGRRLPTEAEWEKAASWDPAAGAKRRFPWGHEAPTERHANVGQRRHRPTPVGSYPAGASAYGVHQLVGDVWEWTSTVFDGHPGFCTFPYREYSEVFFPTSDPTGYRVLRGGSWATDPLMARTTFRNWDLAVRRQIFAGFRTARSLPPGG